MSEINKIENVWFIDRNELKNSNKIVSKVCYKDLEIAVLKEDRNGDIQDFLFKDKDNNYWSLKLLAINFDKFLNPINDLAYCNQYYNHISGLDLGYVFQKKIEKGLYFNKCELSYIAKYFPEKYELALKSREMIIERNRNEEKLQEEELKLKKELELKNTNKEFKNSLSKLKHDIMRGETINSFDFKFYKDNNYDNGITTQNCFLYLAKQYGLQIPLATQGFINNRLVKYNFKNKSCYFNSQNNKRCSNLIFDCFDKIYECVKKELNKEKKLER